MPFRNPSNLTLGKYFIIEQIINVFQRQSGWQRLYRKLGMHSILSLDQAGPGVISGSANK